MTDKTRRHEYDIEPIEQDLPLTLKTLAVAAVIVLLTILASSYFPLGFAG